MAPCSHPRARTLRTYAQPVTRARHWDDVYSSRSPTDVSWYQADAVPSLDLIAEYIPNLDSLAAIIDVGGGESSLVDGLLARGFTNVTVLDASQVALSTTAQRLGDRASTVHWVCADVVEWMPTDTYALWHDRAVFHFLTEPIERTHYVTIASAGIAGGGHLVIGTFAADGPEQCSGLPVMRYSPEDLAAVFAPSFEVVGSQREVHRTPWGAPQPFTWVVLRRVPSARHQLT